MGEINHELEQQSQAVHRAGWEQCQREAANTINECANRGWTNIWATANAIAEMKYREEV